MAKKNKKKSINLAKTLSPEQYGFGSWLKDNAVPLAQTAAGTALVASGAGAPAGVGLIAQGGSGLASNEISRQGGAQEDAALAQGLIGVGGSVASVGAQGGFKGDVDPANNVPAPAGYENGGNLTEYNGNTHEDGGIAIGQGAEVEDKETRWEDYIFSEKVKVPNKKYSFADASKKINKKYSQRENDSYDKKALKREMNALMGMQESERSRMGLVHQEEMNAKFNNGGGIQIGDVQGVEGQPALDPALQMQPDTSGLADWTPQRGPTGAFAIPSNIGKEFDRRNVGVNDFRNKIIQAKGSPAEGFDQQDLIKEGLITQQEATDYADNLQWKNDYYSKLGRPEINYSGENEFGQGAQTNLLDQQLAGKHLAARRVSPKSAPVVIPNNEMGGKLKYQAGGPFNIENDLSTLPGADTYFPGSIAGAPDSINNPININTYSPYVTANEQPSSSGMAGALNEVNYTNEPQKQGGQGLKNAGIFAAQNLGNLYNVIQGAQTPEQIEFDRLDPNLIDDSAATNIARSAYDSAGSVGRQNIRRHATSSGQALSNLIAQNTALAGKKAATLSGIKEDTANRNAMIQNQADQTNLGISQQEEQLNAQTKAAQQAAMSAGLSGLGTSIAGYARDRKGDKLQDATIRNFLKTGEYHIDTNNAGEEVIIHTASGKEQGKI